MMPSITREQFLSYLCQLSEEIVKNSKQTDPTYTELTPSHWTAVLELADLRDVGMEPKNFGQYWWKDAFEHMKRNRAIGTLDLKGEGT